MLTTRTLKAALTALVVTGAVSAGSVYAQSNETEETQAESPVVVERGSNGRATRVRIGETVYSVCQTEDEDGCIQPRAAGLNWGNRPLQHWPGRPASQMDEPAESPEADDR